MMGVISDALIRRSPDRISDTAPGRTPIAVARPPLVLPGFSSPLSIILISSMAASFPSFRSDSNSDYPNQALTLISEYQKLAQEHGIGWGSLRPTRSVRARERPMQSTNWANEHADALREYLAK